MLYNYLVYIFTQGLRKYYTYYQMQRFPYQLPKRLKGTKINKIKEITNIYFAHMYGDGICFVKLIWSAHI